MSGTLQLHAAQIPQEFSAQVTFDTPMSKYTS